MDETIEFFDAVIAPALAEYTEAEAALTRAVVDGEGDTDEVRALVMRRARTAAVELHQFADRVATAKPAWAPNVNIGDLRDWLIAGHLRRINGDPVEDVHILHDVADAFKHSALTMPRKGRAWQVQTDKAVVTTATGYGALGWGEGKYGGVEQVIVTTASGKQRALSLVLKTVDLAWQGAMGRQVDPQYRP